MAADAVIRSLQRKSWNEELAAGCPAASLNQFGLVPGELRLEVSLELHDVVLGQSLAGDNDNPIGRNARLVALEVSGDQLGRGDAPLIGVLHDGAGERTFGDGSEGDRVFV